MENLSNVKIGDKVYIKDRCNNRIKVVTKVLKQYFVADDIRFNFDGTQKGGDKWHRCSCTVLTEEVEKEYTARVIRNRKIKFIESFIIDELSELPIDKIDKIYDFVSQLKVDKED